MARPNVPEFGKWDKEENVPYTVYFDNARKNRGGKIINPNDPQEYAEKPSTKHEETVGKGEQSVQGDLFQSPVHKAVNEPSYDRHGPHSARPSNERSPLHPQQVRYPHPSMAPESPVHPMEARVLKPNLVSNQGFEKSPVHPQQSKHVPRVPGSPLMDGRGRDSSHGINGKPRMAQSKHEQGAATVPRFGQWNDKDQASENFTDIFEKVREEKNSLAGSTPKHPSSSVRSQVSSSANEPKKLCGCFPW